MLQSGAIAKFDIDLLAMATGQFPETNGCSKATRVTKSADSFRSIPNSVITIDFGTTHCSVSYLTSVKACPNPAEVEPVLLKLDNEGRKRVPSCILFDQFGSWNSFGYQARDQYAKLAKAVRPACAFFEHVKKEIQRKEVSQSGPFSAYQSLYIQPLYCM